MLPEDVKSLIEQAEQAVRQGKGPQIRPVLARLNTAEIPDVSRLPLASLCRRVGLISTAMRMLMPLVHGPGRANAAECAEYAVLLQRMGSVEEALWLLQKIDPGAAPEALLYRAFCHFNRWEHEAAVPVLRRYLECDLSEYAKLVGRLNLAAAYSIAGHWEPALEATIECQLSARAGEHWRLFANCLELRAEIALQSRGADSAPAFALGRAKDCLEQASEILRSHKSFDQLFVKKWQSYLRAIESSSVEPLIEFRHLARERREWESVREADLFSLKIAPDAERLDHLTFGTPHAGYRRRIETLLGRATASASYIWKGEGGDGSLIFDVRTGECGSLSIPSPGKKVHALIALLTRDFYRPARLGHIFSEIYHGEQFDIFSSPARVHQLLKRARQWIRSQGLPVEIGEVQGAYFLSFVGGMGFRVVLQPEGVQGFAPYLQRLRRMYPPGRKFSPSAARHQLGLKNSTFKNLMGWACAQGLLERSGLSSATRYRFKAESVVR